MKELIEFSEFIELEKKLEIRVGKVESVEDVPKSSKLLKMMVDFGTDKRVVLTNIKPMLSDPQELVGSQFAFITNLKPVTMMGIESSAMILPGEMEFHGSGAGLRVIGKTGEKIL